MDTAGQIVLIWAVAVAFVLALYMKFGVRRLETVDIPFVEEVKPVEEEKTPFELIREAGSFDDLMNIVDSWHFDTEASDLFLQRISYHYDQLDGDGWAKIYSSAAQGSQLQAIAFNRAILCK